jgi:hypothetical protein
MRRMTATASLAHCPQCGAELGQQDLRCWLCGGLPGAAAVALTARPPPDSHSGAAQGAPLFQFSIGGLLIATALVAVCLGALRVAPGLGVLLAAVALFSVVPAAMRTYAMNKQGATRGGFWISFAISAAASTVGFIACCLSAIVALLLVCGNMNRSSDQEMRALAEMLGMILLFGSPIIGLFVAWIALLWTWPWER